MATFPPKPKHTVAHIGRPCFCREPLVYVEVVVALVVLLLLLVVVVKEGGMDEAWG